MWSILRESAGSIATSARTTTGGIFFGGDIVGKPIEGFPTNPGSPSPHGHVWLRNWFYVIPFCAPDAPSMLTYTFDVHVQAAAVIAIPPAFFFSFVSIGETASFAAGPGILGGNDCGVAA